MRTRGDSAILGQKFPLFCGRHKWIVPSFFPSFTTTDDDPRHPSLRGRAHKKVPTAEDDGDDDDVSSSEFGKNSRENLTSVMDELTD